MQVHEFVPFNNLFLPFCEGKITDSFLTTNFKLINKKTVQNHQKDRKKSVQKIEMVRYLVLFDHTFSDQNYLKMSKFRRYESRT